MSVGQGAHDLKATRRSWRQLTAQVLADGVDELRGEVGDVADGLVLDLAALAVGTAEQVGLVELALVAAGCGGYVKSARSLRQTPMILDPGAMKVKKNIHI